MNKKIVCVFVALTPLVGCQTLKDYFNPTPLSISDGLALIQHDLAQASPVILSQAEHDSQGLTNSIFVAQCLYKLKDPLVPVITSAITVTLTGTFTATTSGTFGWSATGPAGQLGFQVSKAEAQAIGLPVLFVTASSLPDVYLSQTLANVTALDAADDAYNIRKMVTLSASEVRKNLIPIVQDAIDRYPGDSDRCPKKLADAVSNPIHPVIPYTVTLKDMKSVDHSK